MEASADPKKPSAWHPRARRAYSEWLADGKATDFSREAARLEMYARRRKEGHLALKNRYRVLYYVLGVIAVVLAALAGSSAVLGLSNSLIAITAFISAVLTGFVGTIKPEQGRSTQSKQVAAYNEFIGNVRVFQVQLVEGIPDEEKADGLISLIGQLRTIEEADTD